jgi:hypothetical protein
MKSEIKESAVKDWAFTSGGRVFAGIEATDHDDRERAP